MAECVIGAEHLEKQYMRQKAVDDVSFGIKEGTVCGLVGPNGAGKTTIMKMLGGLVLPTAGEMTLFGERGEEELARARRRMSFIIETPYAKEKFTARENLEKQCIQRGIDKSRINEVLELTGLADTGKKQVRAFSLGMRQRLGLANSLLSEPSVMVLDEPINGLDPQGIVEIRELLQRLNREKHITIVISSHILSELSLICTDYLFINHGRIIREISAEELRRECGSSYIIHTDNDGEVPRILREKLGIERFEICSDGSVRLLERTDEQRLISKTLFENGAIPLTLEVREANLEQYYMSMTEGVQGEKDN